MLTARYFSACGLNVVGGERTRPLYARVFIENPPGWIERVSQKPAESNSVPIEEAKVPPCPSSISSGCGLPVGKTATPTRPPGTRLAQLHPDVPPQVLHFMQVPLRTSV